MNYKIFGLCIFTLLFETLAQQVLDPCMLYSTCQQCNAFEPPPSPPGGTRCGWCPSLNGACLTGDLTGPANSSLDCPDWIFDYSRIDSQNTTSTIISPTIVNVTLLPNAPINVTITITNNKLPLDFVILQDLTSSFNDDIITMRGLVNSLTGALLNFQPDTYFGFTSFCDKPIRPFANAAVGDYLFKLQLALTQNISAVNQTIYGYTLCDGIDGPEGMMEGFVQATIRNNIGWRNIATRRIIMLITDAPFHSAGEGFQANLLVPNNYDNITDPFEDYPDIGQVIQILSDPSYNIIPIFAVVNNIIPTYMNLAAAWGRGVVSQNAFDSSSIVEAMTTALNQIAGNVFLTTTSDPFSIVQSISPATGYFNIPTGGQVQFNVTLEAVPANAGTVTQIYLAVTGISNTPIIINVTVASCDACAEISVDPTYCTGCRNNGGICDCGRCDCGQYTTGANCECNLQTGCQNSNCPVASGRAVCNDCTCLCQPGFMTVDPAFPCGCQTFCYPPCNANGNCSCNGTCICIDNYCGALCDCICDDCSAKNNCSDHGTCIECNCKCDPGWTGPNCDICTYNCAIDVCTGIPNCQTCLSKSQCLWCETSTDSSCIEAIVANDTCVFDGDTLINVTTKCPKNDNLGPAAIGGISAAAAVAGIILVALLYKFIQVQRDLIQWRALEKDVRSGMSMMQDSSLYQGNTKEQYSQLYGLHDVSKNNL